MNNLYESFYECPSCGYKTNDYLEDNLCPECSVYMMEIEDYKPDDTSIKSYIELSAFDKWRANYN
jgi:C4-type Zn-finger protein